MANNENLKKGAATRIRTSEEAVKRGRNGGIKSGQARRAKRTMAEIARQISTAEASDKNKKTLEALGVDDESMVNNALITASIFKAAINGNMMAVDKWQALTEAGNEDEKPYELPARVLGKAFVDINREIVPNKSYVFEGGRGGIKSTYISEKIIELLKNNHNMHACIVRKVGGTLKDSVYAQMKWSIHELGLDEEFECKKSPLEIVYKKTGQIIYFRGVDDPVKLKSIKPPFGYIGILWKEEKDQLAGPAEERSINQSVLRGGVDSYDFSSYNPPKSKSNWVNKEKLIPDENRILHHSTYLDAPRAWLGEKFIQDAEHLKEVNPDAYDHEYLGEANGEGGSVFQNLEIRTITDDEIAQMDRIYQGVDWGWYPDIYAFERIYIDQARMKVYLIAENTGNKMLNSVTGQWIIDHGYNDYMITCDSAENKSIKDYKDMGIPARGCNKYPGSVDYTMKGMQAYTFVIDPARTPVAHKEFTEYEYEKDKEGNVISGYPDANNHTIDSIRYAMEPVINQRGNVS